MTADELRELADWLAADDYAAQDRYRAADFLRACADALDAGPVAWVHTEYGNNEYYGAEDESAAVECPSCPACTPLYPLAMPAQAQPLRLPEPLTDEDVDALIDETEYLPTDHAVRYLVETGECRVKEVNE